MPWAPTITAQTKPNPVNSQRRAQGRPRASRMALRRRLALPTGALALMLLAAAALGASAAAAAPGAGSAAPGSVAAAAAPAQTCSTCASCKVSQRGSSSAMQHAHDRQFGRSHANTPSITSHVHGRRAPAGWSARTPAKAAAAARHRARRRAQTPARPPAAATARAPHG